MFPKEILSGLRNNLFIVSEMCPGELIHSKWVCASALFFWSVLKHRKNNEVSISAPEEKCFHKIQVDLEFQTGFATHLMQL